MAPRRFPRSRRDQRRGSGLLESRQPFSYVSVCRGGRSPPERGGLACHCRHQPIRGPPRLLSGIACAYGESINDPTTRRGGCENLHEFFFSSPSRPQPYLPQPPTPPPAAPTAP